MGIEVQMLRKLCIDVLSEPRQKPTSSDGWTD